MTWFPRLSFSTVLLILALIAFAYLGINTARYVLHNHQLGQDENSIRREIDQLDRDNAQLTAVRDYLKTNEYIEYVARRILGLVYPGETLVVVNSDAPAATAPTPAPTTEADPWWKDLFLPTPVPASP